MQIKNTLNGWNNFKTVILRTIIWKHGFVNNKFCNNSLCKCLRVSKQEGGQIHSILECQMPVCKMERLNFFCEPQTSSALQKKKDFGTALQ